MNIEKTILALEKNNYEVSFFKTVKDASQYLESRFNGECIGFGDSETMFHMNLFDSFSLHNKVVDPKHCEAEATFRDTAIKCLTTDIFFTSVNALSETGEMVNIDGTGNRVAGSLFGHKKVYFVVSTNKIEPTLEAAIWRARNIAAPSNAKRLGIRTPCAVKGDRCYNCSSPDRICNGLLIYYKKMNNTDMEIVLIDEKLGF
ncbi:lactate utilization protein [Clostridium estertheticum]|uniref:Lactate utilization protein n=1 Tax=Clostridium estertheticum TaxID=238834 RepID=A0AA47EH56_9CLOT|nr:lactate utilization protein [Clostridium estertheticum]MBU3154197.1 lactate utilization protein [Clostridium estertheticum]MBU3198035.1 lactate utilization protein [Clostridium estertheticum]MCB2353263.1 lactate utilization protein [Clostridium estertheticum]WAG41613.1 lactate utilization protein [Clostridium estertheticum]WAG60092.1 lactate utilization protein [Clostridium estertheticum]